MFPRVSQTTVYLPSLRNHSTRQMRVVVASASSISGNDGSCDLPPIGVPAVG